MTLRPAQALRREPRMPVKKIIKAVLPGRAGDAPGSQTIKRVNLALQGGGAHGAFTWGVLEHLLSDDRLVIEGVSGTSSGAMNAIMLTDGLARGGRPEAQKRLTDFWRSVSSTGDLPPMQRAVVERLLSFTPVEGSPVQAWFDLMARYFSPYDFNPLNINPLKDLVDASSISKPCNRSPIFNSSFRRRMCRPAVCGSFRARRLPPMRSWRPPACRSFFVPSRSTACPIGTAATSATR